VGKTREIANGEPGSVVSIVTATVPPSWRQPQRVAAIVTFAQQHPGFAVAAFASAFSWQLGRFGRLVAADAARMVSAMRRCGALARARGREQRPGRQPEREQADGEASAK
jgi:hypothetical protein